MTNIKHCLILFKWGIRFHIFYHGFFCDYNGFGKRKEEFFSRFNEKRKNSLRIGKFYIEFF